MSHGGAIAVIGRPASGKTTLGRGVVAALREAGVATVLLDGDELRAALVPRLGYDPVARDQFYATLANLAGTLAAQGLWVVVAATMPLERHRERLHRRVAPVLEVLINADYAECEARDPKGLYESFNRGEAPHLPGAGSPFELPLHPDVVASGGRDAAAIARVVGLVARGAVMAEAPVTH